GNEQNGILIFGSNNTIGTDGDGGGIGNENRDDLEGNLIAGNDFFGILVVQDRSRVQPFGGTGGANRISGNRIGVAPELGNPAVPNELGGVYIRASNNLIGIDGNGASDEFEANEITNNGNDGIYIHSGTGNTVRGNSIYDNGSGVDDLGIDLGRTDGVTENDAGDGDVGANRLQNFPTITAATVSLPLPSDPFGPCRITVDVDLSDFEAGAPIVVDVYESDAPDASGNGEGKDYLGSVNAIGGGVAQFIYEFSSADLTDCLAVNRGFITTTATHVILGDTSEFSDAVEIQDAAPAPPAHEDDRSTVAVSESSVSDVWTFEEDASAYDNWETLPVAAIDDSGAFADSITRDSVTENESELLIDLVFSGEF
ncbi:MAG: right-handed parallel beta-helix repeat-containing protein, partial [Planctomycetota bacterium]